MKNIKISSKLLIIFSVIILLFIVNGIFQIYNLEKIEDLQTKSMKGKEDLEKIIDKINIVGELHTTISDIIIHDDKNEARMTWSQSKTKAEKMFNNLEIVLKSDDEIEYLSQSKKQYDILIVKVESKLFPTMFDNDTIHNKKQKIKAIDYEVEDVMHKMKEKLLLIKKIHNKKSKQNVKYFKVIKTNVLKNAIMFFVIILLISIISLMLIFKIVLKPINKAIIFADKVAKGDLKSKLNVDSKDEIGILANSLNIMIDNINLRDIQEQHISEYNSNEIKRISDNLQRLSNGNFNFDNKIKEAQEYTQEYYNNYKNINEKLNIVKNSVTDLIDNTQNITNKITNGILESQIDTTKQKGEFNKISNQINLIISTYIKHLDLLPIPVMQIDKDFNILYMNQFGARMVRSTKKQLFRQKCYQYFNTGDCNTDKCALAIAMNSGQVATSETIANPAGKKLDVKYIGSAIKDISGKVVGAIEIVIDQTAQKKSERITNKINQYQSKEVKKIAQTLEKISIGNLNTKYTVDNYDDDTKLIAQNFDIISKSLKNNKDVLSSITQKAKQIAKGDLTIVLEKRSDKDELIIALTDMIESIGKVIEEVSGASENVAIGSSEMSSTSQQISVGASEQASSAEEISASMEEMVAGIQQNTDNAFHTEKIAVSSSKGIVDSNEATKISVNAIKKIAKKISIIEQIASKTDLLAINAAIEAARAGEHGKGFAVVATEVRKLAENSKKAAKEISELTKISVDATENSGRLLERIVPDITKTAQLVQEINAASQEQNSGAEQINNAIQQLSKVIQQNSASAEEMSSGAEELSSQSELLNDIISYFKTSNSNKKINKNIITETNTPIVNTNTITEKGTSITLDNNNNDSEFEVY